MQCYPQESSAALSEVISSEWPEGRTGTRETKILTPTQGDHPVLEKIEKRIYYTIYTSRGLSHECRLNLRVKRDNTFDYEDGGDEKRGR